MKVLKFGGSSVKDSLRIKDVVSIITNKIKNGDELAVVSSALGGVTDLLMDMGNRAAKGDEKYKELLSEFIKRHTTTAKELLSEENYKAIQAILEENHLVLQNLLYGIFLVREVSGRTMDYMLSFGERNACFIISKALKQDGLPAQYLDARKIIVTNSEFGFAKVNFEKTNENIANYFLENKGFIHVITGFIAAEKNGLTTTLGRGGSDYTAAIIAGGLNAEALEIWTDVDGVLTCDPRKVKKAFTIDQLSYAEAMEMSHFGAKVIYPPTIQPAFDKTIPIYIRNTFNPGFPGTLIHTESDYKSRSFIKGLSALSDISLMHLQGGGMMGIPGSSGRIFSTLAKHNINVILITQASSEYSISFAIDDYNSEQAKYLLNAEFIKEIEAGIIQPVTIEQDLTIVAVVGEKMRSVPGVAGKLFTALGQNGINVIAIAQGSSELNISFVIDKHNETKALNLIHDSFFLSDTKRLHLFIIGVGLIGGTLLKQIEDQAEKLKEEMGLEIHVNGIANSRKMIFDEEGINLSKWNDLLQNGQQESTPELFVEEMKSMNLPNSIFVDNTANKTLPSIYESILMANVSIVTPNKVATSSSYSEYRKLKDIAKEKSIKFLYETNVGAGLPILTTLQSLLNSGDKIITIDAVVSGSLSFIFNNFKSGMSFSGLVEEAKRQGYTEPDPREDLNGSDVTRKIVILARDAGIPLSFEEVMLSPILPVDVMNAVDIESFFTLLKDRDAFFDNKVKAAEKEGKVLRFIASLNDGKAEISLKKVGPESPFYSLEDSDNMIVFHTERYKRRPLVIRGPGAGAEVTAGGVFTDIITIGREK